MIWRREYENNKLNHPKSNGETHIKCMEYNYEKYMIKKFKLIYKIFSTTINLLRIFKIFSYIKET